MRRIAWVTVAAVIVYGSVGCSGSDSVPSAATPTFSPAAGTYTAPQSVTLSCATPGATIYYTLDGSAPTTSSTVYASPIAVSATATVRAIALASGFKESGIASGVYTITATTPAAAPTFSPPGGSYTGMRLVTLSSTTPGARIYYTYDGSTPTTSSWLYHGPIELAYVVELKAIAVADGFAPSQVAVGTYDIRRTHPTVAPTFSPPPGEYTAGQVVTLSCATPNAQILYTTDGTLPDIYSHYHGPITVSSTTTIWAAAYVSYVDDLSDLAMATYTITSATSAGPVTFSPPPGTYNSPQSVSLSCAAPGVPILYWIVEDNPQYATQYTGPIDVSRTLTISSYTLSFVGDAWCGAATGRYVIGGP